MGAAGSVTHSLRVREVMYGGLEGQNRINRGTVMVRNSAEAGRRMKA